MKHLPLVKEFNNTFDSRDWHNLSDLLADDFIFSAPFLNFSNKSDFITFFMNEPPETTKAIDLYFFNNCKQDEYYVVFLLELVGEKSYSIISHQTLGIKDNLISYCNVIANDLPKKTTLKGIVAQQ